MVPHAAFHGGTVRGSINIFHRLALGPRTAIDSQPGDCDDAAALALISRSP
jgi:hypothetical protein